jgi:hypothetical protein
MNISEYFRNKKGAGILATADAEGNVNLAIYTVPHVIDEETVAFVMRNRLTYKNLQSNPHGAYMFIERGQAYSGVRLYLTVRNWEKNSDVIDSLGIQNPKIYPEGLDDSDRFLVYFRVNKIRPLVGDKVAEGII